MTPDVVACRASVRRAAIQQWLSSGGVFEANGGRLRLPRPREVDVGLLWHSFGV